MYLMTSPTVCNFSASSSGTSTENSSSNAITNSTMSSESAPKSSIKDACGVTCSGFTPSCSTIMSFTFSSMDLSAIKICWFEFPVRGKLKAVRASNASKRIKMDVNQFQIVVEAFVLNNDARRGERLYLYMTIEFPGRKEL